MDGAVDGTTPAEDAIADAGSDVEIDADAAIDADGGPRCTGITIIDSLTVLDGGSWVKVNDGSNAPYPQVDMTGEGPAVSLVNPTQLSSLGAIWLSKPVPLHAFDVSFRYLMTCAGNDAAACSDGLAVAWLESTDAGPTALAGYVVAKASFALPQTLRGGAVAFDVHSDTLTGDPATMPDLSLLALDGSVPGQYNWHAKTSARPNMLGAHDVVLRLRKGTIEVKLDGIVVQSGTVTASFTGWFGFGGSSGDQLGTFVVRNFSGTFYACDDP